MLKRMFTFFHFSSSPCTILTTYVLEKQQTVVLQLKENVAYENFIFAE